MRRRNPNVHLADFHGGPPREYFVFMREWNQAVSQVRREQVRLNDFVVMVQRLSDNYPFLELVARQRGIDYTELAVVVFEELEEVARYEITPGFFSNFLTEQYLSVLGDFGGLRLTSEPSGLSRWITQPYFFGYYDWRFEHERLEIPVLEGNISTEILTDGIMYLRVNSFLPKGYETITRNPFLYFCFDWDKQHLMDLYNNLYGIDDLIIDIRGIGSGFREYFVPLLLAPFLHEPVDMRFYAFHSEGSFASQVSYAYRTWYGLGDAVHKDTLTQGFIYDLPVNITMGFPATVMARPTEGVTFEGQIWLLTDSDNFSGPNFAYLLMARDAGFTIMYEDNPDSIGWATSFTSLPNSGLSVRFNPLFFTDEVGRSFEEGGVVYDYPLSYLRELLGVALPKVGGLV